MAENPRFGSGSFKNGIWRQKKFGDSSISQERDFSWICGFREVFTDTLYYHFQSKKVGVNDLDFRQKSKKLIFDHIFEKF